MQLGMVGLGRMGANMVRRLMRDGHDRRRLRRERGRGRAAGGRGRGRGRHRSRTSSPKLETPRAAWVMVPAGVRRRRSSSSSAGCMDAGDIDHRRRQHLLPRRHRPGSGAAPRGHPLHRRRHQRRRLRPRARLLPDDRRRATRSVAAPRADLRTLAPGVGDVDRTPGPHRRPDAGGAGLPALRAERRRPLREDGAQRHRVRADGRLRRGAQRPRTRQRRASTAQSTTPRPRRCASPSTTSTTSTSPKVAEVWRRGSVVASWLLDLTAAALLASTRSSRLRRPRVRLGRGALDGPGRDRRGRAGARADRRPVRALQLAGRGRLRRQAAVGHAQGVRRPRQSCGCRIRNDPRGRHRRNEHAPRAFRRRGA